MQAGRLDRVRPIAEASLAAQLLCELRVQHQHVASTVLSYGTHVKHMCTHWKNDEIQRDQASDVVMHTHPWSSATFIHCLAKESQYYKSV